MQWPKGKRTNNDLQNTTQKTNDWATQSQTYIQCVATSLPNYYVWYLYIKRADDKIPLSSWSTRFVIIQILVYIAVSLPFYFIPSCYNWKKFSVYYYYYNICSARYNTFRKKQKRQSTFVFFSDRSKNPDKSLLLSVLPAIAKKSYIDVGTTPCVSTNIGKIIRIACMNFFILFIILVWLGCSYFFCNDNMSLHVNRLHVMNYIFITRVRNIYIGKQDLPYMEMMHVFCTKNEKGGYGVPGENQRPAASHWQTLSHNVVLSSTPRLSGIRTHNVSGDRYWLHR